MASNIIGRTQCPECEFESAHVKIKTDAPDGKEALPYRYCPGCGATYHPRSKAAAQGLLKKTRLENQTPPPAPASSPPADPEPKVQPGDANLHPPGADSAPKKRSFFGGLDL